MSNEKQVLSLRFNPWMASSPEKIIELLFSDFCKKLAKYSGTIKTQILTYAESLLLSMDGKAFETFKTVVNPSSSNKTISDKYVEINVV